MADLGDGIGGFVPATLERGLVAIERAIGSAQGWLGAIDGRPPSHDTLRPSTEGPDDFDRATSDFANRAARILRYASIVGAGDRGVVDEIAGAARASFGNLLPTSAASALTFPLRLPLSFGSLLAQEMVRGLHAFEIVGVERAPAFLIELVEAFLDYPVFQALQYKEEIDRYRERLHVAPQDAVVRLQLGRSYIKCGLYEQALEELSAAAAHPSTRAQALYERAVAGMRAGRYRQAIADGSAAIEAGASEPRSQHWMWQASRKLGGYPPETPPSRRVEMKAGHAPTALRYRDVAEEIGLDKTSGGRGTAVFDITGSGELDVIIAAVSGGCSVYRNNGDGTFRDASVGSGLDACVNSWGIAAGDYDNDGRTDLFVTRLGYFDGQAALYHNNGNGTFTDVTKESGVDSWAPGFTAGWVDFDLDGRLDLFVPANLGGVFHRSKRHRLFHNNGDGTLTDVTLDAGLTPWTPAVGATWGDYDNDGYPDLFLSSAFGRSQLFHNNRDGTFTDVSRESGIDRPCFGMVAYFCDIDNDGWLDLVQYLWCSNDEMIHSLRHGRATVDGQPLRIYRNNRNGTFTLVNDEMGIVECWGSMSGVGADLDNDGRIDLVLGNGGPQMDRMDPLVVLANDGRRLRNITFAAGLPADGKAHGANAADLHGDGRVSIIAASGGMYPGELLTTSVFRPEALVGNYLNVRLRGVTCNRDAIGARLHLVAGGESRHLVLSGGSNFGCLPLEQHFGLGRERSVERLEIWWPGGSRQVFEGLPPNATIAIAEHDEGYTVVKKGPVLV
ncbi:MAG TPA: CRTAC1 family protein [Vicinamibacterales bacterium]|nr:CRTAC1 family protein [Vicinamibacterales bacterium]